MKRRTLRWGYIYGREWIRENVVEMRDGYPGDVIVFE